MILSFSLIFLILMVFFMISKKSLMETLSTSTFECGYTSYYYSRFSFSIHYYTIGIIFLFLDLELCYLLPFFNTNFSDLKMLSFLMIFLLILILGLLSEWKFNMLDWKF